MSYIVSCYWGVVGSTKLLFHKLLFHNNVMDRNFLFTSDLVLQDTCNTFYEKNKLFNFFDLLKFDVENEIIAFFFEIFFFSKI